MSRLPYHFHFLPYHLASLGAQAVKNRPAMQETWVRFLGLEDNLEKEMATHSRILAWRIPWTEEPGRLQSMGLEESDTTQQLNNNVSSASLVTALTRAAPLNFPGQNMMLGTRFSLSAPFKDFISMVTSLMSTVH